MKIHTKRRFKLQIHKHTYLARRATKSHVCMLLFIFHSHFLYILTHLASFKISVLGILQFLATETHPN